MSESQAATAAAEIARRIPPWLTIVVGLAFVAFMAVYLVIAAWAWKTNTLKTFFPLEVYRQTEAPLGTSIPKGAVIAFDLKDGCPPGGEWKNVVHGKDYRRFAGRTLIVAGPATGHSERGDGFTEARDFGENGGQERVALTVPEMPMHSHTLVRGEADRNNDFVAGRSDSTASNTTWEADGRRIGYSGGSKSHENMPPFIALHFCKKVS